jgi:hypothetical protein
LDQFSGQSKQPIILALRESVLNRNISTHDEAREFQRLEKWYAERGF